MSPGAQLWLALVLGVPAPWAAAQESIREEVRIEGGEAAAVQDEEPSASRAEVDWEGIWRECAALLDAREDRAEGDAATIPDGDPRVAHLWELATTSDGELTESPEDALLLTFLGQQAGRAAELPQWPDEEQHDRWPWSPRASWIAAFALPPGARRDRALLVALETLGEGGAGGSPGGTPAGEQQGDRPSLSGWRLDLAWRVWLDAARDLRFDAALAMGRRIHADQQALWSAQSLAKTATGAGAYDEAQETLLAALESLAGSQEERATLQNQLATLLLGRGSERRARAWYGSAMLSGSADAVASVARLELAAGRIAAARAGFRRALLLPEPGPWARRGWGLSLLPARFDADPANSRAARGY